jgi:FKBP-type peptidyl-prolyl cis-trans isomerase
MKTGSGLEYTETQAGTGAQAVAGKMVSVHYTGKLTNGKVFDSSYTRGEPIAFQLGKEQVIKGWDEGIALMKVGGKATLTIPPELGYGQRGAGGLIPPNATLVFDVELVSVK